MAKYIIDESTLTALANAIREKTGDSNTLSPAEMVTAIEGISGGKTPITFRFWDSYPDPVECTAELGMTWEDWFASPYYQEYQTLNSEPLKNY
jgi:hypothetical protein